MLDKKQIQAIFLFEFKTGHKAAEWKQLATSPMHLAQELIMSVQCSVVARNFAKEMRALKMGNVGVGHQKLTRTYWEQLLKLILLEAHKKLPKNSSLTILWSFSIWSKLERWESSISGCLMIWWKIKKNHHFQVLSSLILCNNNEPFLDQIVMCDEKWIYTTISNDQLNGWTEKKLQTISQSQTCTQEGSWSLFGGLLPMWSTTAFWILVKPLCLRGLLSKLMSFTENYNTCSQRWSTEKGPVLHNTWWLNVAQPMLHWTNWATKFCLIHHTHLTSHQLTTTSSSISTIFWREKTNTTNRRQKALSKCSSNPKA